MKFIIALFLLIIPIHSIFSNDLTLFQQENNFNYALNLYNNNDYYRSITEFKRFIFFSDSKFKKELAEYYIGMNYLNGKDYNNAIQAFQKIYNNHLHSQFEIASLRIADSYLYKEVNNLKPINTYYDIHYEEPTFSEEYYINYLDQNKYLLKYSDEANIKLIDINILNLNKKRAFYLLEHFTSTNTLYQEQKKQLNIINDEIDNIPQKSTVLATIFSIIIPGSGQIYAGDIKRGFITLGINTLFSFSAYYSYVNYSKLLAIIIGYYEVNFYIGNINNTQEAIYKYNENQKFNFRRELLKVAF